MSCKKEFIEIEPTSVFVEGMVFGSEQIEHFCNIKDLNNFNKESIFGWRGDGNESVWVYGIKNGKYWMGVFDEQSKNIEEEWIGRTAASNQEERIEFYNPKETFSYKDEEVLFVASPKMGKGSNSFVYLTKENEFRKITFPKETQYKGSCCLISEDLFFAQKKKGSYNDALDLLSLDGKRIVKDGGWFKTSSLPTFFAGFTEKEEKMYFAKLGEDYSIIEEWIGVETFNRNLKRHLGYGEYEEFYIDKAIVDEEYENVIETENGYAVAMVYLSKEDESNDNHYDVFFLNDDSAYYYPTAKRRNSFDKKFIQKWYKDSYIVDDKYVLSEKAEEIAVFEDELPNEYTLTSYTTGISISVTYIQIGDVVILGSKTPYLYHWNLEKRNVLWKTYIEKLNNVESDSKITATVIKKGGNIWTYRCDILNKDGSKSSFEFTVDITSGKIFT